MNVHSDPTPRRSNARSEEPTTRDKTSSPLYRQLLNLRVGQSINLTYAGDDPTPAPDFHAPTTDYRVVETHVVTNNNGEENFMHIILGSREVRAREDPVLKITLSRGVTSRTTGPRRPDAEWNSAWVQHRQGGNTARASAKWTGQENIESVTVVQGPERCSECGQPLPDDRGAGGEDA
jgi:hypothetical protein